MAILDHVNIIIHNEVTRADMTIVSLAFMSQYTVKNWLRASHTSARREVFVVIAPTIIHHP